MRAQERREVDSPTSTHGNRPSHGTVPERCGSRRDNFRLCAYRGALGLMARGVVSDEDFALLYLASIAFIPPAGFDAR